MNMAQPKRQTRLLSTSSCRRVAAQLVLALMLSTGTAWPALGHVDDPGQKAFQRGDYTTAFRQWEPLVEKGGADAQFGLGLLYQHGLGVSRDPVKAIELFWLAAGQGHEAAQHELGLIFAFGEEAPLNLVAAYVFLSLAESRDHTDAAEDRADLQSLMAPAQIAEGAKSGGAMERANCRDPSDRSAPKVDRSSSSAHALRWSSLHRH